jgi:hypothetical protein
VPQPLSSRALIPFFILLTTTGGLYVDQAFEWGQTATNTWVWALYLALMAVGPKQTRISLGFCLVYAGLGEYLLSEMWGLYNYREGHIPFFVLPGHALLYLLGIALSDKLPKQLIYTVPGILAPYLAYAVWMGTDTEALVWFFVFLAFLKWGPNKKLYTTMFVLALLMEVYGTSLGNWTWTTQVPYTPLTSTNPPACAGVFYCVLDLIVISSTNFFKQRLMVKTELAVTVG